MTKRPLMAESCTIDRKQTSERFLGRTKSPCYAAGVDADGWPSLSRLGFSNAPCSTFASPPDVVVCIAPCSVPATLVISTYVETE